MSDQEQYRFKRTDIFAEWLVSLKNAMAKALIIKRIERAKNGW